MNIPRALFHINLNFRTISTCRAKFVSLKDVNNIKVNDDVSLHKTNSLAPKNLKQIADGLEYCAKNVEERDYENFIATLFMPKKYQSALISVIFYVKIL